MTKLVTLIFLFPVLAFSQELTADSVAISSFDWSGELLKLVLAFMGTVVTWATLRVIPLINAWLKGVMHFKGAAVVADCLTEELGNLSADLQVALRDGTIDPKELQQLKNHAHGRAKMKLEQLSGFTKKYLNEWINDRLSIELGKLLSRI